MTYDIALGNTDIPLLFLLVDDADHLTGKTGLSPAVTLSKNGGAFAVPIGAVSQVGNGWYKVAPNAVDANTLGPLILHATGSGADPTDVVFRVMNGLVEEIWSAPERTLTQAARQVLAAVTGHNLSILRGDTFEASLTGLGSIAARTKLWLTIKRNVGQADTQAIIQITEDDGLLVLNGAEAADDTQGSLTVDDEDAGDVTIVLKAAVTALLAIVPTLYYDIQMLSADGVLTKTSGSVEVTADVTRATS